MSNENENESVPQDDTPEISGEEMLSQNLEAFEAGDDLPFSDSESNANNEADDSDDDSDENPESTDVKRMSREAWEKAGNDPDKYLSQDEFDRVGELRDESNLQLAKRVAQSEGLLKEILSNQKSMLDENSDRVRTETVAKLQAEQKEAVDIGDTDKALELERDIHKHNKPEEAPQKVDQNIQDWHNKNNDWYGVDQSATGLLNVELKRSQNKGISFDEAIVPAMKKVKSVFGYLFDDVESTAKSSNKSSANSSAKPLVRPRSITDSSRQPVANKQKNKTIKDLPVEIQGYAKQVIKKTGISESDYMKAYTNE